MTPVVDRFAANKRSLVTHNDMYNVTLSTNIEMDNRRKKFYVFVGWGPLIRQ